MEFKEKDTLKDFLRANQHPTPIRPVGEWKKIEAEIASLRVADPSAPATPWWNLCFWNPAGVGASLCVASFAAVLMWTPARPSLKTGRMSAPIAVHESAVIDSEEVVWDALYGEDESVEDFEQAYINVLEK